MGKHVLEIQYDYDFVLIGIASHEKDYRTCWALNNKLGIGLTKAKSLEIKGKKQETPSYFSLFNYDLADAFIEYNVIANASENKFATIKQNTLFDNKAIQEEHAEKEFLLSDQKQMDYFFIIKGEVSDNEIQNIVKQIKEIDIILTAIQIDVLQLKSKHNLIF